MKILVTGGAGFIGRSLIRELAKDPKNSIVCLDNYFTGVPDQVEGVEYINGSTNNIDNYLLEKPDVVYHLGEYSRIATSFEDIDKVWELNCHGTYKVIQYCRENKCKLIYAASSSKFGNDGQDENLSPYAWIKAKNVELIKNFGEWFGLEYAIAYFYNVYGPGQITKGKYATVIGIFLEQYKQGQPITVVSPGTQKRYFTHIDDAVAGLEMIGKHGNGDNYCLCDEKSCHSIHEVAKMFSDDIEFIEQQKGNRVDPVVSSRKCNDELGWSTTKSLVKYVKGLKGE